MLGSVQPFDLFIRLFIAKVLLYSCARLWMRKARPGARKSIFAATAVAAVVAVWPYPWLFLFVAIGLRLFEIVQDRLIATINHNFLELIVLMVMWRLWAAPTSCIAVLQVMLTSVWLYSVFQKFFHGEFVNGSFLFCFSFDRPWLLKYGQTWFGLAVPGTPRPAFFTAEPEENRRKLAMILSWLTMAAELVLPGLAILTSGTMTAVAAMIVIAIPVGVISGEISFMVSNVLFALLYTTAFTSAALWEGLRDPVVLALLGWCLLWPPVHAVLARRLKFSSWRLFGWGMYASSDAGLQLVGADGVVKPLRLPKPAPPMRRFMTAFFLARGFGGCRIMPVRRFALRKIFQVYEDEGVTGVILTWRTAERGRLLTTVAICARHALEAEPRWLRIQDEPSHARFTEIVSEHCIGSSARPAQPTG